VRQSVAGLVRRTWSTAQDRPQLLLHLEWWRAYEHFVRPHESLLLALAQPLDRGGKRRPQREKAADASHGRRTHESTLEGPRPADGSAATGADGRSVRVGTRRADGAHERLARVMAGRMGSTMAIVVPAFV
jgi:hypothetical protein